MNPLFHTEFSISDSLKNVRKSVLIYETIIKLPGGAKVEAVEVEVPKPGPGQVLLKMKAASLCGSDLKYIL